MRQRGEPVARVTFLLSLEKKTQKDNMKNKNENRVTVELYDGYLQS